MSKRPVIGLMYIIQGLQAHGEDVAPVVRKFGLDLDSMDPAAQIDRALELRVFMALAEQIKDPMAGIKAGAHFGLAGYGPFTMLLMTCDDAYHALQTGVRYQGCTFLSAGLRFEPGPELSALVLKPIALPEQAFRFRVDGEISGTYKLMRDLQAGLGVDLRPERMEFPYPEPAEKAAYEEYFRCPVTFAAKEARLYIKNEHLRLRFPTADPTAHRVYKGQCDQLLLQREEATMDGLSEKVVQHLGLFTGDFPSATDVADALGMSERSLRRQLASEGTRFRALADRVREDKACAFLLESSLSVEVIAQRMGYGEPASFIRAFQRWTGTTPAAYRRAARAG
ncbi:MAG: AraC family transcriptional regulator [Alcanivoracaceae bacterium]|nr:AraC family transcriptional regulator [Alcanivoracaceae bacterium]